MTSGRANPERGHSHADSDDVNVGAIVYRMCPTVTDEQLNALFAVSWPGYVERVFGSVLQRGLAYVCAYAGSELIGFVMVAWDGGIHGFILDTTVHPLWRRRGIGRELVRRAIAIVREKGLEWLHVDYVAALESFYQGCGFKPTRAGLMHLKPYAR